MERNVLDWIREEKHGLLYRPARWLWRQQEAWRRKHAVSSGSRKGGMEALKEIYGEAKAQDLYRQFQIRKNEKLLTVFLAGMVLALLLAGISVMDSAKSQVRSLKRPDAGTKNQEYVLEVEADGEELSEIAVEVPPRQLNAGESREMLRQAEEEFYRCMEEDGWDPDAVTADISFPETLCNGLVDVHVGSSNYDLMDGMGQVRNELLSEEGELVQLTVTLTCLQEQRILEIPVHVLPEGTDEASRLRRETLRRIEQEAQEGADEVILPEKFEGKALTWHLPRNSYGGWLALLTLMACFMVSMAYERDLAAEGEKRRDELLFGYPSFLSRLTLLIGAGLPVRMAFVRMAKEGEKEDAAPVYVEILRTCREMESGMTELSAYENFGKRCRLSKYRKCASLLSQNVKKGSDGLLAALNQEAMTAFEERKALARKKGEEAQTRLIIPMLMMLVVVMILVMVPACFSMGVL